ncbi:MAG: hypothetical protein NW241_14790 [Bacteroidia bacterium]|nr:hypothetical protein [Bacteroidia bacterium]
MPRTLLLSAALILSLLRLAAQNPPAPGFDLAGSDPRAVALADAVMEAQGGRAAWDRTRYLQWQFFGRRMHTWDKYTGDVRIESPGDSMLYLLNINTVKGRVFQRGTELSDPDSLAKYLRQGHFFWVNDSYWLFMPFKLKDSGVTLAYAGADTLEGRPAEVIELQFKEVGFTPQNKYRVWIDRETQLVSYWAYYAQAADAEPRIQNPWTDYRRCGELMLSGGRGARGLDRIAVLEHVPPGWFSGQ